MKKENLLSQARWLKNALTYFLFNVPIFVLANNNIISNDLYVKKSGEVLQDDIQTRTVVGTIVDSSDKSPVIGANIIIQGDDTGVISDINGHFSINNTSVNN